MQVEMHLMEYSGINLFKLHMQSKRFDVSTALADVLFTIIISCDMFEWNSKGEFRT